MFIDGDVVQNTLILDSCLRVFKVLFACLRVFKQPVCLIFSKKQVFFGYFLGLFRHIFFKTFFSDFSLSTGEIKGFVDGQKVFKLYILIYNMILRWFFGRKKELEELKEATKTGFESVKKDINSVSGWIKHLDSERDLQKRDIEDLKELLSTVQEEIEGVKNVMAIMGDLKNKQLFTTNKRLSNKQTAVLAVQTGVQTGVQTPNLDQFSVTERAIIWVLLNTDMKLSYDDLSAMLGKERSTVRGQINGIKQKNEELISEVLERNGKKRVFIPENIKEKLLKKQKVRVKTLKKQRKNEK